MFLYPSNMHSINKKHAWSLYIANNRQNVADKWRTFKQYRKKTLNDFNTAEVKISSS